MRGDGGGLYGLFHQHVGLGLLVKIQAQGPPFAQEFSLQESALPSAPKLPPVATVFGWHLPVAFPYFFHN